MKNKKLPNEAPVLVLGILSICFCAAWGIPGLVMGIVSLVLYKKDRQVYETDPDAYEQSFKNSNAGKICAIIGVSLSAITFLFILLYFLLIGTFFFGMASTINEVIKHDRTNHQYDSYYDSIIEEDYINEEIELTDSSFFESFEGEDFTDTNALNTNH